MVLAKKLTGTLTAGDTSIVFTDPIINNDSIIEVYTQNDNVYPVDISQAGTSVNILFDRQSVNVGVAIMIINLTQLDDPEDINITDLSDVTVNSLVSGQVLAWNGTKWVNVDLPEVPTVPYELSDLDDVSVVSPTAGQVLTFDGFTWVNEDAPTSGVKYSTTEQKIGEWIDGRPVYRKVITGLSKSCSGGAYTSLGTFTELGIEDIDFVLPSSGVYQNSYGNWRLAYIDAGVHTTNTLTIYPLAATVVNMIILDYVKVGD